MVNSFRRKFFLIFLALVFFLLQGVDAGADIDEIMNRGYLTVAMVSQDAFPFFFRSGDGRFYGFDVDIARDIALNLGVGVVFRRDAESFDDLVDMLASRKADLAISWFSRTLERAQRIRFSKPYFTDRQCLLINRLKYARTCNAKDYVNGLNQRNVTVGTVQGTAYVGFLKNFLPRAAIRLYPNWELCYRDVIAGGIIAGMGSEVSMLSLLYLHPEVSLNVKMVRLPANDYICIGIDPAINEKLSAWVNIFLRLKNYKYSSEGLIGKYGNRFKGLFQ